MQEDEKATDHREVDPDDGPGLWKLFLKVRQGLCFKRAPGLLPLVKKKKTTMKKTLLLIACLSFVSFSAQNPGISKQDKEFAESALKANMEVLKVSELAQTKGFSPEVKELAQHMVADHKKPDDLLRQITAGKSIAVPAALDKDQQKDYNKLSDKVGEDFDKSYTACMAKHHKKIIGLYEKETKKGENTELRAFATNTLPSLNHHKNMADETCKKLKKK